MAHKTRHKKTDGERPLFDEMPVFGCPCDLPSVLSAGTPPVPRTFRYCGVPI